jgi:hypothetical protein
MHALRREVRYASHPNNTCRLARGTPYALCASEVLVEWSVCTMASAPSPHLLHCQCLPDGPNSQKDSFIPDDFGASGVPVD